MRQIRSYCKTTNKIYNTMLYAHEKSWLLNFKKRAFGIDYNDKSYLKIRKSFNRKKVIICVG